MQQPDSDRAKLGWFSYSFSPNQSQRNWFFLIRVAESVPGINTFYNFWLDDEVPPTTGAIKDILGSLATVITLLIGALATFVAAVDFDELTKHNLRFSKKDFQFYASVPSNISWTGSQYFEFATNTYGGPKEARNYYPSTKLHENFCYGFAILFMSLTCVIYTYVEVFSKDFHPFSGDEDDPDNKLVRLAWWRIAKWVLFAALVLYFIGSIFVMNTLDYLLLIKIPNGTNCVNYADPSTTLTGQGSFNSSCPIQFRRAILSLIPSTIGAGILILHSLATANRYRVIRLLDAQLRLEQDEPFQSDDKRVVSPDSAFAQEGCLPCWACPTLDNDPLRVSHPTAASHGAFCCDDLHIEQRVYNPEGNQKEVESNRATNGQAPHPMMTTIQPNVPFYISPQQQQQQRIVTKPPQHPSGGIMLAPLMPQPGPTNTPAVFFS